MIEFIIGIIVGAAFADFWQDLYQKARSKFQQWSDEHISKKETFED
jgi:hypothetical protein